MKTLIEAAVEGMRANGFEVMEVQTAEEGKQALLDLCESIRTIGVGGCTTAQQMGVIPALQEQGVTVWSHTGAKKEEVPAIQENARHAEAYLCSPNAITRDGRLVLTDGRGNRVSTVCDGPKQLIFLSGINKIVEGGYQAAIGRIKTIAAPLNAKRLGIHSACLEKGVCEGAACRAGLCNVTISLEKPPTGRRVTVILIHEALGF